MEKINIAEILKDCPQGMELDCALYENLEFDHIEEDIELFPIECRVKTESGYNIHTFTKYGCNSTNNYSKCVIYPKGKTTWEGFQRPFKDGDIITCTNSMCSFVAIFKEQLSDKTFKRYAVLTLDKNPIFKTNINTSDFIRPRFATEEEQEKLFQAIRDNGYKWNPETKTLEKLIEPKFKVGDKIKNKHTGICDKVIKIYEDCYLVESGWDGQATIDFNIQDNWELVPNKFDINTLVPFESKVLVRDKESHKWKPAIWGFYDKDSLDYQIRVVGGYIYRYCIPYDGNEHLLATTNDCDEYYKTW